MIESRTGIIAILTVVLLLIGTALGMPGSFPTLPDGTVLSPETLYMLIAAVVAPLTLLIAAILGAIHSLQNRASTQAIDPGLAALLGLREFWLAVIGGVIFVIQMFTNITLFNEGTQAILVDALLAVIGLFLWGSTRPAIQASRR